jgi:hypothetical protein
MKKKPTKKTDNSPYHLLFYCVDSNPKIKRFETTDELGRFIDAFNKKYPESQAQESGSWTDFCVTGIMGDVHFFTDGLQVE